VRDFEFLPHPVSVHLAMRSFDRKCAATSKAAGRSPAACGSSQAAIAPLPAAQITLPLLLDHSSAHVASPPVSTRGSFHKILMSLSRQARALSPRLKFGRNDVQRTIFSIHKAMPNAPTEGCDVDFFGVFGVRNDPMSPFEVKPMYARPIFPAVV
jgi:hypothetical protein